MSDDYSLTREESLALLRFNGGSRENILSILLELQKASPNGCIGEETARLVAEELGMTYAQVHQVISFYDLLETKTQAKYVLRICNSTPCWYSKADEIAAMLEEELGVPMGETTPDGLFAYHYIPCVGACEIGPVIAIKDAVYGNLDREKVGRLIAELRRGDRVT